MEHRHVAQLHAAWRDLAGEAEVHAGVEGGLGRNHRALWPPGGAGGVEQGRRRGSLDRLRRYRRDARQGLGEIVLGAEGKTEDARGQEGFDRRPGGLRELVLAEHQARLGVLEKNGKLGPGQPPVHRHEDHASARAGIEQDHMAPAVARQHGHALARRRQAAQQGVAAANLLLKFAIGQDAAVAQVMNGDLARPYSRLPGDRVLRQPAIVGEVACLIAHVSRRFLDAFTALFVSNTYNLPHPTATR
jgi:hypothetical protein